MPGSGGEFRFQRDERLKKGSEIKMVFSKGKRTGCQGAKLFALENGLARNRVCFTLSRGFACAVRRNRAKRLGREAYRLLSPGLRRGYDLVFLALPEDAETGLERRMGQMRRLFAKSGLAR